MYTVKQLKWNEIHSKWNDIKFPEPYQQYLQEVYGITIDNGRVLWGHVIEVTIQEAIQQGGAPSEVSGGKKKKVRKKIKLIFIMGEIRSEETKEVKDLISPKIISDVQNKIEEQINTKISLKDVQIIKG